ncbi:hypothetical protein K443DRAFT_15422 [Laccaria amethystina LaAM-08-1]|uniref:Uncharacterized protein n=1 Tax=Laccaria amethystina LaAM-08-1 TaxID=1095629 RepID=A0A0C9WXR4_9AGAR|nr:hypothetical protein K443DRAFT_15422 [Laccaria amethystina LaAM-08-1]
MKSSQCTSGNQFYHKIQAVAWEAMIVIHSVAYVFHWDFSLKSLGDLINIGI